MPGLLVRRKSSIKTLPIVKTKVEAPGIEFRWSISASQMALLEENLSANFHLINLDNSQKKSSLTAQSRSSISTEKQSPHLPRIHNPSSLSPSPQPQPLLLTYSQLHRAQHHSPPKKKKSQTRSSMYPDSDTSSSETKYVRLHTPQLRRLHVSEKYLKEAKTLYFNTSSKVFVPRLSIEEIS